MQNSIPVALILGVSLIVAAFQRSPAWGPGFLSLRPTLRIASKLGLGRRLHASGVSLAKMRFTDLWPVLSKWPAFALSLSPALARSLAFRRKHRRRNLDVLSL
jgi:hypothetical protein